MTQDPAAWAAVPETMLAWPPRPDFLGQCGGFATAITVAIRACEIVFKFAHAFGHGVLRIWTRRRNITQLDQLFERLRGSDRVKLGLRGMEASVTSHFVPTLNWFGRQRLLENGVQHLAVHVFAGRQAEQ